MDDDAIASPDPDPIASPDADDHNASPEPESIASPDAEPIYSHDSEPMPSPDAIASPDDEAIASPDPEPILSPEPEPILSPDPEPMLSPAHVQIASPDNEEIASPDADDQQMSDDNPSVESTPHSISSPDQMDEGSQDNGSEPEPAQPLPSSPTPASPPSPTQNQAPDKPEITTNNLMDSKTVETLEGELDFEEEIHEKEDDVPEDSPAVVVSDEKPALVVKKEIKEKITMVEKPNEDVLEDNDQDEGEICDEKDEIKKPVLAPEDGEKDDGEVSDEDDLEEGEVKDGASVRKSFPRPVCRFFNKGQCTWGSSCRFIHPGVNDKGNYNMFSPTKPPGLGMMMGGPPMPLPPPMRPMPLPRMRPMIGPDYRPPPLEDAPPVESAWERGLRHAKEILKKASRRKEQEPDFEDKRMNLSLENTDRPYEYEREPADKFARSPYRRFSDSFPEEGVDPYELADREHQEMWRGGRYENFEVRWNRQDYEYRDFHEKEARARRYSRSMEREKYERRSPEAERWQDERYGEAAAVSRGRADEWRDPWRRSKTPKGRRSRSQNRTGGRRSYSSGSSRSFSSRSSYSYSSSSSSKSSHFTSESPSRSRSRSHSRPGSRPRVPSRQGIAAYGYNKSPPKGPEGKDMYEPRRKAPPRAPPRQIPGSMGGIGPGMREHPIRSPTMARNSSPPTRPPPRKGPSPVRKVVNISPLSKFSPPHKLTPPRKPSTPTKISGPKTPSSSRRNKGSSHAPPQDQMMHLGAAVGPGSPPNRRGPGPPREHRHKEPGMPKTDEHRSRKSRSASFTASETSRTLSHTPSRSSRSRSTSLSRSRSRSFSRSVSMSSVSSASSSGSRSSNNSIGGTKKKKTPKPDSGLGPPGSGFKREGAKSPPPAPLRGEAPRGKSGEPKIRGGEPRNRDRSRERKARNTEQRYDEYEEQMQASGSYSDRSNSSALTIPLLVSKQSKDLLKQSGQKPQIKLTLLSKAQKHSVVDKAILKAEIAKLKQAERAEEAPPRSARPHPPSPTTPPPPPPVVSRKRPATSPPPPPPPAPKPPGALPTKQDLKKSSSSRREELLKQLKAVEDAIARKRSKLS